MLNHVQNEASLETVSVGQLVKRTVWARNNQLTISGKTPIELAHGRRPPDLLDVETESPESLTEDPLITDKLDRIVKKVALKSHLEARQAEDLRLDLSRNIRPSDGPFKPGDRVFVWEKDINKIKDTGRWIRGKVLAHSGPMVTIEVPNAVIKVNQSKVRLDHDEWHDVPIPLLDDPGEEEPEQPQDQLRPLRQLSKKTNPESVPAAEEAGIPHSVASFNNR